MSGTQEFVICLLGLTYALVVVLAWIALYKYDEMEDNDGE